MWGCATFLPMGIIYPPPVPVPALLDYAPILLKPVLLFFWSVRNLTQQVWSSGELPAPEYQFTKTWVGKRNMITYIAPMVLGKHRY